MKYDNYDFKIQTENDLVVHKVTSKDKDKEEIDTKFKEFNNKIQTHNGELKVIYATSKEREHKKKFDYMHTYAIRKPCDNINGDDDKEKDHKAIRQDTIKYYKEQQKKQEENKVKIDSVLEKLVENGIFSADELGGFGSGDTGRKNANSNTHNVDNNMHSVNNNMHSVNNNMHNTNENNNKISDKKQMYLERKKK